MLRSTPQYAAAVSVGFSTVPNGLGFIPPLNMDPTGLQDGVLGPAGFSDNQTFNMATIGNGNWYFGTDNAGGSSFGVIKPGNGNTYRLAGGGGGSTTGGGLFIGTANNIADQGGKATPVIIGDTRIGATGTVRYGIAQGYTGSTTVNAASNMVVDFSVPAANATNLYPAASQLVLAGGTFSTNGHATSTNSQTVNGLLVNPGQGSVLANNNAIANNMLVNLGVIVRNAGGTVDFVNPANGTLSTTNGITTTSTNTLFPGGAAASILGGFATVSGTDWAQVNADSTITKFTNYAGDFSTPGTDVNVPGGSTALAGDTIVNSLRFAGGATDIDSQANTNKLTIASGGILETSAVGR